MRELGRGDDAFAAYNRAIALDPNIAEAHAGCGNMLAALRRYDEAIKAYDKALAIAPGIEFVESERLHCKMRLCDWSNFSSELQHLTGQAKTGKLDAHPFEFLSMSNSAQEQLECAKTWISRKYAASTTPGGGVRYITMTGFAWLMSLPTSANTPFHILQQACSNATTKQNLK